jgi:hypothetical protein
MSFFADTDQLYSCIQMLFDRIGEEEPGSADAILASRLVIRLCCSGPEAELTINGRQRPLETTFGPSRLRPTLDIELTADTLHRIMLGDLSLASALAHGRLRVRGLVWKTSALAELFYRGQALYPGVLRDQGLLPDPSRVWLHGSE